MYGKVLSLYYHFIVTVLSHMFCTLNRFKGLFKFMSVNKLRTLNISKLDLILS